MTQSLGRTVSNFPRYAMSPLSYNYYLAGRHSDDRLPQGASFAPTVGIFPLRARPCSGTHDGPGDAHGRLLLCLHDLRGMLHVFRSYVAKQAAQGHWGGHAMKSLLKRVDSTILRAMPILRPVYQTRDTRTPVALRSLLAYRFSRPHALYWPTHALSVTADPHRINIDIETSQGLVRARQVQGSNRAHVACGPVRIGCFCRPGAHADVLLGEHADGAADPVVMRSLERGYQAPTGHPARVIRELRPAEGLLHRGADEFHGPIPARDFAPFRQLHLDSIR